MFIYIVFPNEESIEVCLYSRKPVHVSHIHRIFYIFISTMLSTNRSRNVGKQDNHQGRENTLRELEGYIFLRYLYFSAVRSTVQLSLGTVGMWNSGHITMVYKFFNVKIKFFLCTYFVYPSTNFPISNSLLLHLFIFYPISCCRVSLTKFTIYHLV